MAGAVVGYSEEVKGVVENRNRAKFASVYALPTKSLLIPAPAPATTR